MKPFEFHGELFELRGVVLEALSDNGFVWLSDFSSVDLAHDIYGLEVTGICEQVRAAEIEQLLRGLFPDWRFHRRFYEDHNLREIGWKVIISRDRETTDSDWQLSVGSPKPPEESATEIQDGSPGPDLAILDITSAQLRLVERLIDAASEQLLDPDLCAATRAEMQEHLKKLRDMQKRFQEEKRKLLNQEGKDE
jgi:hypothetical protein